MGRLRPAAVAAAVVLAGLVLVVAGWPVLERTSATKVGYTPESQPRQGFVLDAYDTISSVGFFRSKAAELTRGQQSVDGRLDALMLWTNENVRPQYAAPNRIVADNAWDITRRGYGSCDQVNHIFATLATYAGFQAQLLFAWTSPRHEASPHAVAEVLVDGRWVIVDAWQGVVWRGGGQLLSADDATPELMDRLGYSRWKIEAQWFKWGTPFRTFPYASGVELAGRVLNKLRRGPNATPPSAISPPMLTPTPTVSAGAAPVPQATPAPLATPNPPAPASPSAAPIAPSPSAAPFPTPSSSPLPVPSATPPAPTTPTPVSQPAPTASPITVTRLVPSDGQLILYDQARRAQLDGDYQAASDLFAKVIGANPPPDLVESAQFWLGLTLFRGGHAELAVSEFAGALATQPDTAWAPSLHEYQAKALETLGQREAAIAQYQAALTPSALARLQELGATVPPVG